MDNGVNVEAVSRQLSAVSRLLALDRLTPNCSTPLTV